MAETGRTYIIAGAGIAGLTAALTLSETAGRVIVLERNDRLQEFGAGLQISPNARRVLDRVGLDPTLQMTAFASDGIDVFPFGSAAPLVTLELGEYARTHFGVPYTVMHRADLADALYAACKTTPNIDVRFGIESYSVKQTGEGVTVDLSGSGDSDEKIDAFALIGADGVGSQVRTQWLEGPEAEYSGYVAWRTLIDMEKLKNTFDLTRTSLLWAKGYHAAIYPLPLRGKINIALFTREKFSAAFGLRTTPNLPPDAGQDPRFAAILAQNPDWSHWPLATVDTPVWHKGAIGLIGDAAHAMLPFQAQGAAMAIEDGAVLARSLASTTSAEAGFFSYAERRRPRVSRVAARSASNGRIFHMSGPLSVARNLVVRTRGNRGHLRQLSWIYDYRV